MARNLAARYWLQLVSVHRCLGQYPELVRLENLITNLSHGLDGSWCARDNFQSHRHLDPYLGMSGLVLRFGALFIHNALLFIRSLCRADLTTVRMSPTPPQP